MEMGRAKPSIRDRILRAQTVVAVASLLLCALFLSVIHLYVLRTKMQAEAEALAKMFAVNLSSSLTFLDSRHAETTLASLKEDEDILFACALDRSGKPFAKFLSGAIQEAMTRNLPCDSWPLQLSGISVLASQPILQVGDTPGRLYIALNQHSLRKIYFQSIEFLSLVMMLGLLFARWLALRTSQPLSEGLEKLTRCLKHITAERDYTGNLERPTDPRSEIAEVSSLFDEVTSLLQVVRARERQIVEANTYLEEKVANRTHELEAAQMSLIQASRFSALGEMAGGIAHEINNPLAIITGRSEQLIRAAQAGNVDTVAFEKALTMIHQTALRIAKIIRGMKAVSRNASSDPLEPRSLIGLIGETLEFCRERFKHGEVRLTVPSTDPGFTVDCRPSEISQVFLNLLNNAFEAVKGTPDAWVEIQLHRDGDKMRIAIVDSGHGISPEIRERVMEPFFTTKSVGEGTGLGLSISKAIAEAHGGKLWVDSHARNTTLVLELPLSAVAAKKAAA